MNDETVTPELEETVTEEVETAAAEAPKAKMYNLTLSEDVLNKILGILGQQKYTESSELISVLFQESKLVTAEKAA